MKKLSLFLIIIIIFAGCGKNTVEPEIDIYSYPINVGNQWIYEVYENITSEYDTVVVTIVDSIPMRAFATEDHLSCMEIWELKYLEHTDSIEVLIHVDNFQLFFENMIINIMYPLEVSKSWGNDIYYDSAFVLEKNTVSTLYGSFRDSYRIESGRYGGPALHYYEAFKEYWLTSDVGMVKLYVRITDGLAITDSYTWNLIDINISR